MGSIKSLPNNNYTIDGYDKNFDILEYYTQNKNGVKSKKSYIAINKQDPYEIRGEVQIKHLGTGIIIEFHEEAHSGYNPKLEITSNGRINNYSLYRKEKNFPRSLC